MSVISSHYIFLDWFILIWRRKLTINLMCICPSTDERGCDAIAMEWMHCKQWSFLILTLWIHIAQLADKIIEPSTMSNDEHSQVSKNWRRQLLCLWKSSIVLKSFDLVQWTNVFKLRRQEFSTNWRTTELAFLNSCPKMENNLFPLSGCFALSIQNTNALQWRKQIIANQCKNNWIQCHVFYTLGKNDKNHQILQNTDLMTN